MKPVARRPVPSRWRVPVESDLHCDVLGGAPPPRAAGVDQRHVARVAKTKGQLARVSRATREILLTNRGSQVQVFPRDFDLADSRIARLFRAPLRICRGVLRATTVSIRCVHLKYAGSAARRGAVHGQRRNCSTSCSTRSGFESDATKSRLPGPQRFRAPSHRAAVSQSVGASAGKVRIDGGGAGSDSSERRGAKTGDVGLVDEHERLVQAQRPHRAVDGA